MRDLEFIIKTKAELGGVESAIKEFERLKGVAMAKGQDASGLDAQIARAKKAMADFQAANPGKGIGLFGQLNAQLVEIIPGLDKVESAFGKLASGTLGKVSLGFAAAAGAVGVAKKAIEEFSGFEVAVVRLDQALGQNGELTDANREKLQDYADELQKLTGIADDAWLAVIRRLVQFGASTGEIEKATEAVKNLAGLMDGDLQGAAQAIGKAMNGSFESFSRLGIAIDETATKSQKLEKLYAELAKRGAGQLEASTRTLSGQFRELGNNTGDLLKAIGIWIASTGVLQVALTGINTVLETIGDSMRKVIPSMDGVVNRFRTARDNAADAKEAIKKLSEKMDEAAVSAKTLETNMKTASERLNAISTEEDNLAEAKKENELSRIEYLAKFGVLSAEKAAKARLEIENRYEDERLKRHIDSIQQQMQIELAMLQAGMDREQGLRKKLAEIKDQKQRATTVGRLESQVTLDEANFQQSDKKYREAKAEFDRWTSTGMLRHPEIFGISGPIDAPEEGKRVAEQYVEEALKERDRYRHVLDSTKKKFAATKPPRASVEQLTGEQTLTEKELEDEADANTVKGAASREKIDHWNIETEYARRRREVQRSTMRLRTAEEIQTQGSERFEERYKEIPHAGRNPYQRRINLPREFGAESSQLQQAIDHMGVQYRGAATDLLGTIRRQTEEMATLRNQIAAVTRTTTLHQGYWQRNGVR